MGRFALATGRWGARPLAFLRQGFPLVGKELLNAMVGMNLDAGEQVSQVGKGIELVAFGGLDETVQSYGGVSAAFAAGEEPVLSPEA